MKRKIHIVANSDDEHISSGLKNSVYEYHNISSFQFYFYKATEKRFLIVQRKRRLPLKSTDQVFRVGSC